MKLADYVIDFIGDKGVEKIFVLYGSANGHLIDAFTRSKKTEYVATMHEQAAGYAAECYGKIKGVPGVAIATSGPGALNLVNPIANCFYDSVPGVFITGNVNMQFMRPDPSVRQVGFQETDIISIVAPISKSAVIITDPNDIRYELEKAFFLAQDGRPGPCVIDIPIDIQKAEIEPNKLFSMETGTFRESFDLDAVDMQIDQLIEDLKAAKRPTLLVGGGVRVGGAVELVREISKIGSLPAFPTWNALDIITSDFENYGGRIGTYGGAGRNFGIQNSDLILAVGSRISGRITGGNIHTFGREAKKYVVDVDRALLQPKLQQVPFDVNIFCDVKIFAEKLLVRLQEEVSAEKFPKYKKWNDQCRDWRIRFDPVRKEMFDSGSYKFEGNEYTHPYAFTRRLSEKMDDNSILICDLGGTSVVVGHAFETRFGQSYLTNNGNAPMGFSMCGAMGAWMADPSRQTVAIIGDGGMILNIQELQTLVNYKINIKTFILNNHIYGITKAFQETNFNGRCEACGPVGYNPPNFVKVAEGFGIKTFSIENNAQIDQVVDQVLAHDGPAVCDVNNHEYHTYEPRIFGWNTPIEDMYPYLPRDEFLKNMLIQPVEGWEEPAMPDVVNVNSQAGDLATKTME